MSNNNPVGHPTMKIDDIKPTLSPAYSKNLHQWMKKYGHQYLDGGLHKLCTVSYQVPV